MRTRTLKKQATRNRKELEARILNNVNKRVEQERNKVLVATPDEQEPAPEPELVPNASTMQTRNLKKPVNEATRGTMKRKELEARILNNVNKRVEQERNKVLVATPDEKEPAPEPELVPNELATSTTRTLRARNRSNLKDNNTISVTKKLAGEATPSSKKRKEFEERVHKQSESLRTFVKKAGTKKTRVEDVVGTSIAQEPEPQPEPVTRVWQIMEGGDAISNDPEPDNVGSDTEGRVTISNEQGQEPGNVGSDTEGAREMVLQQSASQNLSGTSLGASCPGEYGGEDLDLIKQKKIVHFNDKGQPIGDGSAAFTTYLGSVMRKHCPISYEKWRDVPDQIKEKLWELATDEYIVPVAYKQKVLEKILNYWRSFKSILRSKHYDSYDTDGERKRNCPKGINQNVWNIFVDNQSTPAAQARRKAGKLARQAMKTPHISGRTGAARMAEALKNGDPFATVTRTDLYLAMHSRKDGSCPTPELTSKVEQIKAIAKENPSSINLDVDHDPVAQVYGPERKSFVRGMGTGVTKSSLAQSAPAVDQLQHERRLRIFAEEQIARLKKAAGTQGTPAAVNPVEEDRARAPAAVTPIEESRAAVNLNEEDRPAAVTPNEESRTLVSAEEEIAALKQKLNSQREQIDQLERERMSRLTADAQMTDLREQITLQGLMILGLKEQMTRLYS